MPPQSDPARRRRQGLSEEVASHVRSQIMSGELVAGDFVRMDRVAEVLGVSSTPVREGLQVLSGEGFLTFEARRGFVVVPMTPDDVQDLFLVQADIAGELAARAAAAVTPPWLQGLTDVQQALTCAAHDGRLQDVVELNRAFHQQVNRRAGSPKLAWMLAVAVRFAPEELFTRIEGWPAAAVHDHDTVLAAMAHEDPEQAREAMRSHVLHAGALLADTLRRRAGPR